MKRIAFLNLLLFITNFLFSGSWEHDLTIVGRWKWRDSMGRSSIGIADCLRDQLRINFINVEPYHDLDLSDTPVHLHAIAQSPNKNAGKVSLLVDHVWFRWNQPYTYVPKGSLINIAYSMIEATRLPRITVSILNTHFDAVVVPDPWLIEVYKNSGVKKPIFVIPHGIYLDDFLKESLKQKANKIFTFGLSALFFSWKNHIRVLKGFAAAFGNNKNVRLIMHGRNGDVKELNQFIRLHNLKNVEIIVKEFSQAEYMHFLRSLDCYVFLSRGEGFSITPREAMAMGIPVILSSATAHKTICDSGLVVPVKADIPCPAYYDSFSSMCGVNFDCKTKDAARAMKKMYKNYNHYVTYSQRARDWVIQYTYPQLRSLFLTLVKPQEVRLSTENKIEANILYTSSNELYKKYEELLGDCKEVIDKAYN